MHIFLLTILAWLPLVVQPIPFGHFNPYGMIGGAIGAGGAIGGLMGAGGLATGGQNVFFLNKFRQKKLYHHEIDHQHQSGLLGSKFIGGGAVAGALGAGGALAGGGLAGGLPAGGLPAGVGGGALASALGTSGALAAGLPAAGGGALGSALGADGALAGGLPVRGGGALNGDYGDGYHRTLGNVAAYDDAVGSGSGALGGAYGGNYARYPRAGYESLNGYAPIIGNGNTRMASGPYQTDYRRYTDS